MHKISRILRKNKAYFFKKVEKRGQKGGQVLFFACLENLIQTH